MPFAWGPLSAHGCNETADLICPPGRARPRGHAAVGGWKDGRGVPHCRRSKEVGRYDCERLLDAVVKVLPDTDSHRTDFKISAGWSEVLNILFSGSFGSQLSILKT